MDDFIFTPIVFAIGLAIHFLVVRRSTTEEGQLLTLAFGAHAVAALVQVWLVLYYFPGGDIVGYFDTGRNASAALSLDFGRFLPEVAVAFFQGDYHLPVDLNTSGSTLSMAAAAGMILFVVGDSLYAASMLIGVLAYASQWLVFRALRANLPPEFNRLILIGTCLIPSGVFWSSTLLKEPLVMVAIGPLVFGLHLLANGHRRIWALVLMGSSSIVLSMLKPYVLIALSLAAGVFYLWRRLQIGAAQLKPFAIFSAIALTLAGLVFGARYFNKSEGDNSAATLAAQRHVGYDNEGGSNYYLDELGPSGESGERTLGQEILLAPLGLVTALFRPFIFEVKNVVQFVNALEATLLLILFVQAFFRLGVSRTFRVISSSPILMFCVTFTLALGLGTGLASSNLGTLSRYRAPMMPFYFTVVLLLRYGFRPVGAVRSLVPSSLRPAAVPER